MDSVPATFLNVGLQANTVNLDSQHVSFRLPDGGGHIAAPCPLRELLVCQRVGETAANCSAGLAPLSVRKAVEQSIVDVPKSAVTEHHNDLASFNSGEHVVENGPHIGQVGRRFPAVLEVLH